MKKIELTVGLDVFDRNSLSEEDEAIIVESVLQLDYAYAPYSNFHVGSAVMMEDGSIYGGCNQENASYPLCMCAERVAIYHATIAKPHLKIKKIAITARNPKQKMTQPVMPCGACRQVILEYEQRHQQDIVLLFRADDEVIYSLPNAKSLLPFFFDSTFL